MKSLFPDICSDHIPESRDFYVKLLGFKVLYDIGWYVQLQSPTDESVQLAFVQRDHSSVPERYRETPRGVVITAEVDAVDPIYKAAKEQGCEIAYELQDEDFGQRHFMTLDPNGLLVDVIQMIPPSEEFLRKYGLGQ